MKTKHFLLITILMLVVLLPTNAQSIAWQRSDSLGKGTNVFAYSINDVLNHKNEDFLLMNQLGFKHIRIHTRLTEVADTVYPYTINDTIFYYLDTLIKYSLNNKLKVIIGNWPNKNNGELSSLTYIHESERIAMIWKQMTQHYFNYNPDSLYFEIVNEPFVFGLSSSEWIFTANRIIDTIRTIDQQKTILVYANNPLISPDSINDDNIIYTYHFYDPFIFTTQGATFTNPPMYTTGIPFPYDSLLMPPLDPLDSGTNNEVLYNNYPNTGVTATILSHLNHAKIYSLYNDVPVHCGEFGVRIGDAPITSSLFWLELIRKKLDSLDIPWTHFQWKRGVWWDGGDCGMFNCDNCISLDSVYKDNNNNSILCALGLDSCLITLVADVPLISNVKIYPNPFSKTTTLEITSWKNQNYKLKLYDLFGREVRKYEISNQETEISRGNLPCGMYFYQVKDSKQLISSGKLIVQ